MQARAGLCERADVRIPAGAKRLDGTGKYVIPGLMDANVHLLLDVSPEYLLEANFRYEPQILEAAQIALKHGVTTVFDDNVTFLSHFGGGGLDLVEWQL